MEIVLIFKYQNTQYKNTIQYKKTSNQYNKIVQ